MVADIYDKNELQQDLNSLAKWSKKWQLPFNETRCKVIHYGKKNPKNQYDMNGVVLECDTEEKDLGVTFDADLKFSAHIRNIAAKVNSRVGIIKRTFSTLNKENFPLLYKSFVRPLLEIVEYCTPIWCPTLSKNILESEKIQIRATKLVEGLQNVEYEDRLKILGLPTLSTLL